MTTLTDIVAAVVVQSSAVALSHFGVTLEPTQVERPQPVAERVVARSHTPKAVRLTICPPKQGREPVALNRA